jgi:predicted DNA binding CopG/RHH family protein
MKEEKYLDREEKELIESIETGGWRPVKNLNEWKSRLSKAAADTLTKDQRMNIRITKNDFNGIKLRAMEEGIPYQTLVSSLIHKYLSGRLVENGRKTS